ncbi:MAG: carboxynorspermidine decarboxylase [Bacteroidaceae bacterium]|nr:carboxynorspermidine decarboxylase [Bacteroidaceae bacterium]
MNSYPNPCYIIEENLLRRNLSLIQSVSQRADVEIILAFKAFALWKSFPVFREYIRHTTASSLYEARLAMEEFGSKAHTYSPAYTEEEFDEIARYSSHITFNSLSQFEHFHQRAEAQGVSCGLRVNPEYSEIETELYNPCAPGSRFGVLAEELEESRIMRNEELGIEGKKTESNHSSFLIPHSSFPIKGFHIHCLCENGADTFARTLEHIEAKFSRWFNQLEWINFGGGHLMTRKDYDIELLINTLNAFHRRYPHLRVIMEPGSAFAWQTGTLRSRVIDIVENKGIKTAILNVSFTCHMPDCLEMPYWPAVRGAITVEDSQSSQEESSNCKSSNCTYIYRLGGNSCLSGDFMGSWHFDHELQIGEEIIFEDMIHYTTVKTNMFNGISHPSIGMLHSDGSFELYKKFQYEDYRDRMC